MSDDYYNDDDVITGSTLDAIGADLEEGQEIWERYAYLAVPKMPCPECGGTGSVAGGSLGSACVRCNGARTLDHPGAEAPEIPDFSGMRTALSNYSIALADHALPDGHRAKKHLALPPASTLPRPEAIQKARDAIKKASKQLAGAPPMALPAPQQESRGSLGDGDADFSDADLDGCIDADTER
jgi:hypothetical protein